MSDLKVLKWPGSKYKQRVAIGSILSSAGDFSEGRLIVPFLGSAAVVLEVRPQNALLADSQTALMQFYDRAVNDDSLVSHVYGYLASAFNAADSKDERSSIYYPARAWFNQTPGEEARHLLPATIPYPSRLSSATRQYAFDQATRAAVFLFLNKTGFNGLQRYNRSGKFNVPMGSYEKIKSYILLDALSEAMRGWTMLRYDFSIMMLANAGDVVYCDPPYCEKFSGYTAEGFSESDHVRLAGYMVGLAERGVKVFTSNSASETTGRIYGGCGFNFMEMDTSHSIAADGKSRGAVKEYLIGNIV